MSFRTEVHHGLRPEDEQLLDRLVEAGFEREALENLSPAESKRAAALMTLFGLLEDYPVEDADDALVHATLDRVATEESAATERRRFVASAEKAETERRGWRIPVPDFISVAAVLLIAASVAWPVIEANRQHALDARCANNMRVLGSAFEAYARDHDGVVPMGLDPFGAGQGFLHERLAPEYCSSGHLACPGHDNAIPYSRQMLPATARFSWLSGPITAVLGDRNPVIDAGGALIDPYGNSANHKRRGQNILMKDGATEWLEKPVKDGDDIWLIQGQTTFDRKQAPETASDIYLAW